MSISNQPNVNGKPNKVIDSYLYPLGRNILKADILVCTTVGSLAKRRLGFSVLK